MADKSSAYKYLVRAEVPDALVEAELGHVVVDLGEGPELVHLGAARLVDGLVYGSHGQSATENSLKHFTENF